MKKDIVSIDCAMSLDDLLRVGNYNKIPDDFSAFEFPIGEGVVEYEVTYFCSKSHDTVTILDMIKKEDTENPWEPATVRHLLAIGAAFPDHCNFSTTVALGTVRVFNDVRWAPTLYRYNPGLGIGLQPLSLRWGTTYRFLAVRKVIRDSVS